MFSYDRLLSACMLLLTVVAVIITVSFDKYSMCVYFWIQIFAQWQTFLFLYQLIIVLIFNCRSLFSAHTLSSLILFAFFSLHFFLFLLLLPIQNILADANFQTIEIITCNFPHSVLEFHSR